MTTRLSSLSTSVLRAMDRTLDGLPPSVLGRLRSAIKHELLHRAIDRLIADGAQPVAPIEGVQ